MQIELTQKYSDYPKTPDNLGILLVVITTIIMCHSYLVPVIPILIFLGMWAPFIYYKKTFILKPTTDLIITLLFPFLCIASVFWSWAPKISLYSGTQFIVMATYMVVMARIVKFDAFLKGVTIGLSLILITSLLFALKHYGGRVFNMPLVGLFGSKNVLGYCSIICIIASLFILTSHLPKLQKLIFGLGPLGIAFITLTLSHSATSLIGLTSVLFLLCAAFILSKFPKPIQILIILVTITGIVTTTIFIFALDINPTASILKALGKDPTLTGRTYLWGEGIKAGMNTPILGTGYNAFWLPGNPLAERYWEEFYITGKSGFNFHNVYVEAFVSSGIIGLISVILLFFVPFIASLKFVLKYGLDRQNGYLFAISSLMFIRSFAEVEIFGPFGMQCLIFYTLIPMLTIYKTNKNAEQKNEAIA